MKVLFLGCVYSETQKDFFLRISRRGYQFAAQNYQESVLKGFCQNDVDLTVLTIPSLSTYPVGNRKMVIQDSPFCFEGKNLGYSVGYLNVPFLKRPSRNKIMSIIKEWAESKPGPKHIVVYALLSLQMSIAIEAKHRFPGITISIIVPDLPRYMGCNKVYEYLGLRDRDINRIYSSVTEFDSFIVLAKPMMDDLGVSFKPYVVVEGIYADNNDYPQEAKEKHKTILYTGNIAGRYGIQKLMDAFTLIDDPDYRLWIRGTGDNTHILEMAAKDNRISYIGPLSRRDLVILQKKATILINPVSPEEVFTKYFFPSKTMDYLASGTPTLMYQLDCIPTEYLPYLYLIPSGGVEALSSFIKEICSKDVEELYSFGNSAAKFIKDKKNAKVQVAKILELLKSQE